MQATCPFNDDNVCSDCGRVDWSDPAPNETCERAIADYCSSSLNSEASPGACFDYLDLFTSCEYNGLAASEQTAFQLGATEGRDGKGIVYIFASGNEHHAGADVNFEGALTSRYTLSVGAVGKDGLHASYSTGGEGLLVVAPGGDADHYTNNLVANPGGGCTHIGPGTSFAAPIVSGVVALILQANEDLSWRDVHGILATTSKVIDSSHESWSINGAGLQHSTLYGFGLVDAGAAVKAALTWDLYSEEQQVIIASGDVEVDIPEYPQDGVESTVQVNNALTVEAINVYLDLLHSSRGDLEIVLTSPSGTESVLHPSRRPENNAEERWKFLTVKHWDEPAKGAWTLKLIDHREGSLEDCVDHFWNIKGDILDISCRVLERALACENGGEGRNFRSIFGRISLDDESLRDDDNVSPADACCTCGGGSSTDDFQNTLHSWQLVLFGHETPSASGIESNEETTANPSATAAAQIPTPSETVDTPPEPTPDPTEGAAIGTAVLPSLIPNIINTDSPSMEPTTKLTKGPTASPTVKPSTTQINDDAAGAQQASMEESTGGVTAEPTASPTTTNVVATTTTTNVTSQSPTKGPTQGPTTSPVGTTTNSPTVSPTTAAPTTGTPSQHPTSTSPTTFLPSSEPSVVTETRAPTQKLPPTVEVRETSSTAVIPMSVVPWTVLLAVLFTTTLLLVA